MTGYSSNDNSKLTGCLVFADPVVSIFHGPSTLAQRRHGVRRVDSYTLAPTHLSGAARSGDEGLPRVPRSLPPPYEAPENRDQHHLVGT